MRESQLAVVERDVEWRSEVETEPWEASWACEAVFFVRLLEPQRLQTAFSLRVQVSPDGMRWCDEGTRLELSPGSELGWCRVSHFGGWLRLRGTVSGETGLRVIVYLHLKE